MLGSAALLVDSKLTGAVQAYEGARFTAAGSLLGYSCWASCVSCTPLAETTGSFTVIPLPHSTKSAAEPRPFCRNHLPPRRSDMSRQSVCEMPCSLRPTREDSAFGVILSRPPVGSLSWRPGDSLTAPRTVLSVGFLRFVSFTDATLATGRRLLPRWDSPPTEQASLLLVTLGPGNSNVFPGVLRERSSPQRNGR